MTAIVFDGTCAGGPAARRFASAFSRAVTPDVPMVEQPAASIPSDERTAKRYVKDKIGRIEFIVLTLEGEPAAQFATYPTTPRTSGSDFEQA